MSANSFGAGASEGGDFQVAFESMTYGTWQAPDKKLPAAKAAPAIPARAGSSGPIAQPSTGGGIASPLTEALYSERTFFPLHTKTSPDGLFTMSFYPAKSIRFLDADSAEVILNFKEPPV